MGRSTDKEIGLGEQRKYRSWTAQQKLEIVLAGMRGDRSVRDVCREHGISETLYYGWRDKILEAGREALAGKEDARVSGSCAARSASSSARLAVRPTSSRSREKRCERGSERARRSRSGAGRRRRGAGGGGARVAGQPASRLPITEAATAAAAAAGDRSGRPGDRGDGEELPDRRL